MPIDYALLRGAPGYVCRARDCGSSDVQVVRTENPDKPIKLRCKTCGRVTWPPKPENENRRRDRNGDHRKRWKRELADEFICAWCRVRASETRCEFDCDHVQPLEFGGADEFENTMMLCSNCHSIRNAMQAAVRHLLGKSARADRLEAA